MCLVVHAICDPVVASQVMKIGVVRVLALEIPALLQVLCKGGWSRFGLWRKAVVAMAERAWHVGHLPDACTTAPGFVSV